MKKLIGHIGVDSGQVLICDPCYIDSEWEQEDFQDIRKYQVVATGEICEYPRDFKNYENVIPKYGVTMNQMIDAGLVKLVNRDDVEGFSYNACCNKTLSPKGYGQLNYKMGHAGVGVVTSTAFGDGEYPVYAEIDRDGTIRRITIDFMEDDHDFDDEDDEE